MIITGSVIKEITVFIKMQSDVNIVRVASLIRELNKSKIEIEGNVDLDDIASIERAIDKYKPDFVVNSSRAYSGLKYGSISSRTRSATQVPSTASSPS